MSTDDSFMWDDEEIIELVDVVEDDDFFAAGAASATSEEVDLSLSLEEIELDEEIISVAEEDEEKDPLTTATLAEIYISQGFYKRALKIYRDLADQNPGNDDFRKKLLELKAVIDDDEEQARSAAVGDGFEADEAVAVESSGTDSDALEFAGDASVTVLEGWLENIRRMRECRYGNC